MVKFVKGKAIIGPALAIIGGLLLILTPVFIPLITLPVIMAVVFGIVGLCGGLVAAISEPIGNYIAIVIGLIAIIGTIMLFVTSFYFEPILVLVGGVLGVVIKEEWRILIELLKSPFFFKKLVPLKCYLLIEITVHTENVEDHYQEIVKKNKLL